MNMTVFILALLLMGSLNVFGQTTQKRVGTIHKQIEGIIGDHYRFPQFTVETEAKKSVYFINDDLQWEKTDGLFLVVNTQWYSTSPFYKNFTEYTCKFQKGNIQITIDMSKDRYMYIHNFFHADNDNVIHRSENMGGEWKPIGKDDIGKMVKEIKDLYTKRK